MSEAPVVNPSPCPVPLSVLRGNFQNHVDPKAPVPLRMMGAKALVPMAPKEMATALFMLTFDPDPTVRETAVKSAAGLPDRILSVALRDDTMDAQALDYYAGIFSSKNEYLEMLVLNPATPDSAVQRITERADEKIVEIVAQNQLRMLRHADIVRALVNNKALEDLPAFRAARRRIHGGTEQDEELAKKVAADQAIAEAQAEAALVKMGAAAPDSGEETQPPLPGSPEEKEQEQKKLSITQQIMKLGVAKKIEWANKKGNREVRTILLRDNNKLVQLAVIQSPRMTEGEIGKVALSRTAPQEVLSFIYNNRQLMKNYQIKLNIVNNPKVPVGVSMRFLSSLRAAEVKVVAKNRNVSQGLATAAKKLLEKKGGGE
jgi:hypothetical protein